MTPPVSNQVSATINEILSKGWSRIPDDLNGHGAVGLYLEKLFGSKNDNLDIPDLDGWEIKYHGGGSNLVTLFHKDASPQGHQKDLIKKFGKYREDGEISFRHTIRGGAKPTNRGFYLSVSETKVEIKNIYEKEFIFPYWDNEEIINAFIAKLRRLIFITGQTVAREVKYEKAYTFENPPLSKSY